MSGKIKAPTETPTTGRYSDEHGRIGSLYRTRYFRDATFGALRLIEPVAQRHGLTLIETALRWVVHHSALRVGGVAADAAADDGVIIGVSSFEQLQGNLRDLEKGPLPEEVVAVLDEAWMLCKATAPDYWHGELVYGYDTRKALFGGT